MRLGGFLVAVAFFGWMWWRLAQVPFHEDEAIYAAWALAMARGDWGVWQIPIDKPPLTLYPLAAMMAFGARAEWMVRLPTFLWGIVGLWAVGRVADQLGRNGWLARGLVLASPLWWAMWASAFTDMAAVALGMTGLLLWLKGNQNRMQGAESGKQQADDDDKISHYRVGSGVIMGLAVLAKPTMVFLLPLVVLVVLGRRTQTTAGRKAGLFRSVPLGRDETATSPSREEETIEQRWRGFVEGFAGVLLLAWAWDASRDAPSWWRLGAEAYGTLGRGWSEWQAWLWLGIGAVGLPLAYCLLCIAYERRGNAGRRRQDAGTTNGELRNEQREEDTPFENTFKGGEITRFLLSAFRCPVGWIIVLWIPVHFLLGFQPWERYLLPLVVLVGIWLSPRTSGRHVQEATANPYLLLPLYLLILIAPRLPSPLRFAPQDGRWNGIREVGAFVETLPPETDVWYRSIGRPLAWYGADTPATLQWAGVEWDAFPGCTEERYVAERLEETVPEGLELVMSKGDFGVWKCIK